MKTAICRATTLAAKDQGRSAIQIQIKSQHEKRRPADECITKPGAPELPYFPRSRRKHEGATHINSNKQQGNQHAEAIPRPALQWFIANQAPCPITGHEPHDGPDFEMLGETIKEEMPEWLEAVRRFDSV